MPRIRQLAGKYRTEDFQKAVAHCRVDVGADQIKDIAAESGIPNSTLCKRLRNPDTFTIDELRRFLAVVPVSAYALLAFLGYAQKDIKGFLEDST